MSQRFDLGVHHFLRADYERASRYFREVLREEPHNARAWSYYGMAEAHLGHGAEAEAALSRALEIAPTNAQAWFHLGVARSLREEWGDAASAYRRAVAFAPNDLVAWHRLGVALAEAGDEPSAGAAFERALVLSRETEERDPARSVRPELEDSHVGEAAVKEGSREAKSWLDLALSLLSLGDEAEALAAYERARTIDPERAKHSLFGPMLKLVNAAEGEPEPVDGWEPQEEDVLRPPRREPPGPPEPQRPEVA